MISLSFYTTRGLWYDEIAPTLRVSLSGPPPCLDPLRRLLDRQRLSRITKSREVDKGIRSVAFHRHDTEITAKVSTV